MSESVPVSESVSVPASGAVPKAAATPGPAPEPGERPPAPGREAVRFASAGTDCAAWHYPTRNGACVIMAGGFAVTKEPATNLFARRFHEAGYGVLAFDYRRIGESGGEPRQVVRNGDQVADWHAAIEFARTLPGVDPARIAVWGFSLSGGHVIKVAAQSPDVAAAIAQTPNPDGQVVARNALRHQKPGAMLRFTGLAVIDSIVGVFGRPALTVPLGGPPGSVSALTTPDVVETDQALGAANGGSSNWLPAVAARSALASGFYRPGRYASQVRCPLLVVVCDQDQSAVPGPALQVAEDAPRGELVRLPGMHYAPFLAAHEEAVAAQLAFLERHVGGSGGQAAPGARAAATGNAHG
ncbi:alpha/beta hydrolase [Streptomyces sp. CA-111067]|uniref:alpha/beta hydrolase n=1 Tax=Streptomyces sp. CA-111067 TaxID=3240046 RepID=UPI003D95E668